jgi:hypothetical protein
MSAEAVGAYIRLLCYQWDKDGVPDDDAAMSRIAGCGINTVVSIRNKFGKGSDGKLRNARLEIVREKQDAFRRTQTKNIQKRWAGHKKRDEKHTMVLPNHIPNGYSPSPSPSPSPISEQSSAGKPRQRNGFADSLARACGLNPLEMPSRAARTCAISANEIRKIAPDCDEGELRRRADEYRKRYHGVSITPSALCTHWAEFPLKPMRNGRPQEEIDAEQARIAKSFQTT